VSVTFVFLANDNTGASRPGLTYFCWQRRLKFKFGFGLFLVLVDLDSFSIE